MSFGGSVSAMIASLKNNARPKRKTYFDRDAKSLKRNKKRNPLLDIKATPEQIKKIRKSITFENRRERIKSIVIFSITAIVLIVVVVIMNNYHQF